MDEKYIKYAIGVALAVLLLISGFFYFSNKTPAYIPAENQRENRTGIAGSDKAGNWEIYTDIAWNFSFKYPDSYGLRSYPLEKTDNFIDANIIQISNIKTNDPEQVLQIKIIKQPFEASGKIYNTVEEFVKNYSKIDSFKTVYLGSDKFIEVKSVNTEVESVELRSLFALKDGYVFQILAPTADENFTKMADSFRFTK